MSDCSYGADPEVFAYYVEDNKPYAFSPVTLEEMYGLLPIKKDFKHPTYYENDRGKVIMDGVAFEINLKAPYFTAEEMFKDIQNIWKEFNGYLKSRTGATTIALPSINFDYNKWWTTEVDFDERKLQGYIFGCDHSFNAKEALKGKEAQNPEIDARHHPFRYGGGHLHFSDEVLVGSILQSVRVMDMILGTYFLSMSTFQQEETQRSLIYGKPGGFRPQEYKNGKKGVEYRTCSNNWMNLDYKDELAYLEVLIDKVKVLLTDRNKLHNAFKEYQGPADKAIESADFDTCKQIWKSIMSI
jgi:hypothetical protein